MKLLGALLLLLSVTSSGGSFRYVTSGDHLRIAYTVQGSGPAMVVVPGGPGLDGAYMREAVKGLHAQAYVMDLRGTGASHAPETPAFITVAKIIDDMERLRESLHLNTWIVMGHSFGGYIAQAYTVKYPNRVRALILVSSSAPDLGVEAQVQQQVASMLSGPDRAKMRRLQMLNRTDADAAMQGQMDTLLPYFFADRSKWPKIKPLMDPPHNSYAMARALYADLSLNHNAGSLRGFRTPAMAIYGQKDGGVDVFAHAILQNTGNARVAVVKNAGHFIWLEQPAVFRRTVNAFLTAATR